MKFQLLVDCYKHLYSKSMQQIKTANISCWSNKRMWSLNNWTNGQIIFHNKLRF